jgi:hypothetical protein
MSPRRARHEAFREQSKAGEMSSNWRPPFDTTGLSDALAGAPTPSSGPGSPQRRILLRLAAALLTLVLIAVVVVQGSRVPATTLPRPTPTATPAGAFLPLAGLNCISDAAWAPTSDLIAFVGPTGSACDEGTGFATQLNIYRARSRSLVRRILPDSAVYSALGLPITPSATPGTGGPPGVILSYATLRWSPDGTQLALSFGVYPNNPASAGPVVNNGLVLVNADGSHERVFIDRRTGPQAPYTVWDLESGTPVTVSANAVPDDAPYSTIVPARSYSWGVGGTLVPGAPFSQTTSLPAGLVGTPIGAAQFGPWQPGTVQVIQEPLSGQRPIQYLCLYDTTFAAWSPDGRYVAEGLQVQRLLAPPAALPGWTDTALPAQTISAASLPARDAAVSQALAAMTSASGEFGNPVPLAWRPDGKVLAVLTAHNGFVLRATDTGRVVRSVPVMQQPVGQPLLPGYPGTWDVPLWSPDGKWLLLPTAALVDTSELGI